MATKPSTLMRFAHTATGLARRVAMSSGLTQDGYATNAVPTAGNFDAWFGLLGEWISYLDEIFDDAVEMASTLDVTGIIYAIGGMVVNGDLKLDDSVPFGEIRHNYLKTCVVGIPSYIAANASYNPSNKYVSTTGASTVVFTFPVDGGMHPYTLSVEYARASGSGTVDGTAVLINSDGTERTVSAAPGSYTTGFQWLDISVSAASGWPVPIPRTGQAALNLWVELSAANLKIRKAVLWYNRPSL